MAGKMLYDFETALKTLLYAQSDVMTLVQKWAEMVSQNPQYVTFTLKGKDGTPETHRIPNLQMVISNLEAGILPSDPHFNSVTTTSPGGRATLTNSSVEFAGTNSGAHYAPLGMEHTVWIPEGEIVLSEWPVPRCWSIRSNTTVQVTLRPRVGDTGVMHGTDFFVYAAAGASVTLAAPTIGATKSMVLTAGDDVTVWHVFMSALDVREGLSVTLRAVKLNVVDGTEG